MQVHTVRDVMVPLSTYPHLRETATLRDAFVVLHEAFGQGRRYRHILVLDNQQQLIGLLGLRDIMRGLFPNYLRTKEHPAHEGPIPDFPALTVIWQETCDTQCKEAAKNPVKGFMDKIRATIKSGSPLTMAAYLMVINDISMLPVVDDGKLVGVVRMIDVFNQAAGVILHD
jgi:CBS domain-containing protein